MALLDDIRTAIRDSGLTRYRISQDTGISQAHLSKLMSGERGMTIGLAETLLDYLGLEITVRPKRKPKRGK